MTAQSFKGISTKEIKQRVLCIGGFDEDSLWITRLFSSEEVAIAAKEKLHDAHGNSIITWIRPLNKREMNSVFGFGNLFEEKEFDFIDNDSLLIEVIRVSIGVIPMDAPTDRNKIAKKIHVDFHARDAILACAEIETAIEEKNEKWGQPGCHWFWVNEGRRVICNEYNVKKTEDAARITHSLVELLYRSIKDNN